MHIFNESQGPLPASWIGCSRCIISVKLKLIPQVVTPLGSHMLMDGRTSMQSFILFLKLAATQSWLLSSCLSVIMSLVLSFVASSQTIYPKTYHQSQLILAITNTILSLEPHILISGPYFSYQCHYICYNGGVAESSNIKTHGGVSCWSQHHIFPVGPSIIKIPGRGPSWSQHHKDTWSGSQLVPAS